MNISKRRVWLIAEGSPNKRIKLIEIANYLLQKNIDDDICLILLQSDTDKIFYYQFLQDVFCEINESICGIKGDAKFFFFSHRSIPENIYLFKMFLKYRKSSVILLCNLISLQNYYLTGKDDRKNIFKSVRKTYRIEFLIFLKVILLVSFFYLLRLSYLFEKKSAAKIHKILIVKFDVFGDMVVALPYLKAIKCNFPDAEVSLLASQKGISFVEAYTKTVQNIIFDKMIVWDAPWHYRRIMKLGTFDFIEIIKKAFELRKNDYDSIIQCREHGIAVWFSRIIAKNHLTSIYDPRLILSRQMSSFIENKINVSGMEIHHMVEYNRMILDDICPGIDIKDTYLEEIAIPFLTWRGTCDLKILINLGAGMPIRQWNPAKYSELILKINQCLSAKPVILCGPNETLLYDQVVEPLGEAFYGYRGNLSLTELIQLVAQSDIVVTADTGVMHLAASCNKKILAIFGAGEVDLCRPLGNKHFIVRKELGCSGCVDSCFQKTTPPPCLDLITVDDVFNGLLNLIDNKYLWDKS